MYSIERDAEYSTHTGMVFGQYVSDADRKPRTRGYRVLRDGKPVAYFTRQREARAYIARRDETS